MSWIKAHVNIWELCAALLHSGSEEGRAERGERERETECCLGFQSFTGSYFRLSSHQAQIFLGSKKQLKIVNIYQALAMCPVCCRY